MELEEEEDEAGKSKEVSKGHLFLARDSQMQSERHSSLQNLEQQLKAHKSRTFCNNKSKGQEKSKLSAFPCEEIKIENGNSQFLFFGGVQQIRT